MELLLLALLTVTHLLRKPTGLLMIFSWESSSSYRKQLTYCQTLQKHPLIVLPPPRPNDLRKPWISLLFIGSHPSPNPSVTQNNQYITRTNEHLNADASYFYPTTYLALAIPIVIFLP